MSEPRGSVFARLRSPAALNYLVVTAAGLLGYFLIMSGQENGTGALLAILIAVPGILARWVISPVLVLLVTTYLLIDPGFSNLTGQVLPLLTRAGATRWVPPFNSSGFNFEDVGLAASLLAYLIGHFRLTAIIHQGMPDDPGFRGDREADRPPVRPAGAVPADELPWGLTVAAAAVAVGQVAWLGLMTAERARRPHQFAAGTARLLLLVWAIGGGLLLIAAGLVYVRAARMSRREASLALRDTHFHEMRRETGRLHTWRQWFKEKAAARRRAGK